MTEALDNLSQLTGLGRDLLWSAFLVFLRVGAAMALLPAFGEHSVPMRVRMALTLALTAVIMPIVAASLPRTGAFSATDLFLSETAAGLILGIGLRLFVLALQLAGSMIAQATSLSHLFASAGAEAQPAVGHLLVLSGLALAMAAGLHLQMIKGLILSYQVLSLGGLPQAVDVADWGLAGVTRAFALAFALAAPFTAGALIYNLALGVINRAMPQLMVAFVGAPALTLGGLILTVLILPTGLSTWLDGFGSAALNPFGTAP